ncbi:auxilin-like clathrin uncoating factor Swa2p [Monosporozyma servazzii]
MGNRSRGQQGKQGYHTIMSDPFANLLDSFKQGAGKKTPQQSASPPTTSGKPPSQLDVKQPLRDDLDLLFDSGGPNNNTTSSQSNDDWDKAFDIFNNSTSAPTQNNNSTSAPIQNNNSTSAPIQNNNTADDTHPEDKEVVDEVKDMEIAQIMSLGYTFQQSLNYYNKGLSYETLLERQMASQRKPIDLQRNHFDLDRDTIPVGTPSVGETLMDSAWNMFNKSKKIVDSWTQFDSNEANRLNQGRGGYQRENNRLNQGRGEYQYENNRSSNGRSEYQNENNRLYQEGSHYQQDDNDYEDIDDFPNEFDNKLDLNDSPPLPSPSQNNNNLIDFDISESGSNKNIADSTPIIADNSLLDVDQASNAQNTLLDFDQPSPQDNTITSTSQQTIKSPISDIELLSYNEFKDNATQLFKNGHYAEALEQYTKSLNTLPQTHPLRLIAISNMMISQLKIGEYNNVVKLNESCHKLYSNDQNNWKCIIPNSVPGRTFKDIWSKIMLRYAEALEHLENYKIALTTYQDMIDKNITNTKVLEGKRRCEKVINPEKFKSTPTPSRTPVSKPSPKKSSDDISPKNTENVDRIKQINVNLEKEADLKVKLYDQVELKINNWKANKPDDIRYLLSNLNNVITWTNWNPVSTTDLVMPKKVKVTYMKAVAKTHPDKIPASLDLENKMIAENVFAILSEAWEKFKLENNIA